MVAPKQDRSFDGYLEAQEHNLREIRPLPEFVFIEAIAELYEHSIRLVAKDPQPYMMQLLVICHQALLSAATLVGRALPGDSGAITRRAIEAACLGRAIKHDEKNVERWTSADARLARWEARARGARTKRVETNITYPPQHRLIEALRLKQGMLSDSGIHFSPEYLYLHPARVAQEGASGKSVVFPYFQASQRQIERSLMFLAVVHIEILDLFVESFGMTLHRDKGWHRRRSAISERGKELVRSFQRNADYAGNNE